MYACLPYRISYMLEPVIKKKGGSSNWGAEK